MELSWELTSSCLLVLGSATPTKSVLQGSPHESLPKSLYFGVDPLLLVTSCATARVVDLTRVHLSAVSGSSRHQFWLHQIRFGFSRVHSRNVLEYASSSRLIWLRFRVRLHVLFALISTSKVRSHLAFV